MKIEECFDTVYIIQFNLLEHLVTWSFYITSVTHLPLRDFSQFIEYRFSFSVVELTVKYCFCRKGIIITLQPSCRRFTKFRSAGLMDWKRKVLSIVQLTFLILPFPISFRGKMWKTKFKSLDILDLLSWSINGRTYFHKCAPKCTSKHTKSFSCCHTENKVQKKSVLQSILQKEIRFNCV